jgi:hypothetical protein
METAIAIVVGGGLLAALFLFIFRSRAATRITDPTVGFMNLAGDEFSHLVDQDRSALASLFTNVEFGASYPFLRAMRCSFMQTLAPMVRSGLMRV